MKKQLVTVVMSAYNEPKKIIKESIESILNQSYENIEFIIVNDNPDREELKDILLFYASSDQRIRVIENDENIGLVKSLNKGIDASKSNYIVRMDADDISLSNRIQMELDYLLNNSCDIVGTEVNFIDEKGDHLDGGFKQIEKNKIQDVLLITNCVPHPTWMVKKEVYLKLNKYREIPCCEDYDFLLRALKAGYKIGIVPSCLLNYRINKTGISQSNALPQFILSSYLSKQNTHKQTVTTSEMFLLYKKIKADLQSCAAYEKALPLIEQSVYLLKKKKPIESLNRLITAVFISKYAIVYILKRVKIKMIMLSI